MYEITIPKLNSNDDSYVLTEWLFNDGDQVPPGAEVVVVETSKAAEELACETGGVLLRQAKVTQECKPGDVVGRLFADEAERQRFLAAKPETVEEGGTANGRLVITDPARELLERHQISADRLRALGKRHITRSDVERLIGGDDPSPAGAGERYELSRGQRAIAEVVTRSHRSIPAAFAAVKVVVGPALESLRLQAGQTQGSAGLPELLVRCVARLHDRFPLFFATLLDEGRAGLSAKPQIGVTIDVGTGLFVPVFKDPAGDSLDRLAGQLMDFRIKALRGGFSGTDLDGANLTISLPVDDVILAQPLVLPPQICMLALGATHLEPSFDAKGEVVAQSVVNLGISYDHRLINGRDAALFLREIKRTLETPDLLRSALR